MTETALTTAAEWLDEARQCYASGDFAAAEAAACISSVTGHREHEAQVDRWRIEELDRIERERADDRAALAERDEAGVQRQVEAALEIERRRHAMFDELFRDGAKDAKGGEAR